MTARETIYSQLIIDGVRRAHEVIEFADIHDTMGFVFYVALDESELAHFLAGDDGCDAPSILFTCCYKDGFEQFRVSAFAPKSEMHRNLQCQILEMTPF
jgi:hypothetical protein